MSFWELSIIIVVGLLVIGPERLPDTIKTIFRFVTKAKRTMNNVRTDFEKQIGADEIRRELRNEEVMANLEKLKSLRTDIGNTIEHQGDHHEESHDDDFLELDAHEDDHYTPHKDSDTSSNEAAKSDATKNKAVDTKISESVDIDKTNSSSKASANS